MIYKYSAHVPSVGHLKADVTLRAVDTHCSLGVRLSDTHRVLWLTLGVPALGERVKEALAGTNRGGFVSETSGGLKNLHAGLKSVESAEHTQAGRGTEDPLLVKCARASAVLCSY